MLSNSLGDFFLLAQKLLIFTYNLVVVCKKPSFNCQCFLSIHSHEARTVETLIISKMEQKPSKKIQSNVYHTKSLKKCHPKGHLV